MKPIWLIALFVSATGAASAAEAPRSLTDQQLKKLAGVHRLYVEELAGEGAHAIRDLVDRHRGWLEASGARFLLVGDGPKMPAVKQALSEASKTRGGRTWPF